MSTELVEVQNAVAQMNKVEAGLEALRKEYRGVLYPVATAAGMEAAKLARRLIREPRFEVEKIRKAAKAPILALGKKLDSEAQRITRELTLIEAPIDMQITQEEDRIAAEKQARIDAEMARIREIQMRIEDIRNAPALCAAREPDAISVHIFDIQGTVIDASFAEFEQEASKAKDTTLAALRGLHAAAVAREVENARIAAERAELAKLRREQEERERADKVKRDEEERVAREARNAEAVRIAGEHRAQREAFEREQAEARERQAAEDRRIAEDRAKLQREQEALRKANELPPARKNVHNPGREAIAEVVSHFYSVEASTAMRWLREIDWEAVSA
jgi:colicin import membrane protein